MKNIPEIKNKIFERTQLVVIITDADQEDNPIIYANRGFTELTGYTEEEVLGQNCRFLQGEDTDPKAIKKLKDAVRNFEAASIDILNYKKNGEPFWNQLHIDPIYIEEDNKRYFIGMQKDITSFKHAQKQVEEYYREIELLSTPIVPVGEGISVLPLIGNIDGERVGNIFEKVLPVLAKENAEHLILDLSGFTNMDEEATIGIFQLSDLLKLKGIQLIITGITPQIAMKTKELDISSDNFITFRSVRQAVESLERNDI
ncbi:PAS domain-containing protein [Salipaludibacillus sp. CUR1]|uniref:PAS domain-containing protein n=1 Tax=Salipaludibacillus sp. CUR1 TaxID=2820003 RepID=UPI001E2DA6B1|nr:PAS domain-containing protein [Salipaludibacillus sp. CUR1]